MTFGLVSFCFGPVVHRCRSSRDLCFPCVLRVLSRRLGGKKPGNLNGSCVRDPVAGDYFVISPPGAGRALGVGA